MYNILSPESGHFQQQNTPYRSRMGTSKDFFLELQTLKDLVTAAKGKYGEQCDTPVEFTIVLGRNLKADCRRYKG